MARNSEKRLSGLNRFLEAKETEKTSKLQRPPLCRLATADDVKGWIPSIQKEINYLLKQIEGTGSRKHNDNNVEQFQERIEHLKHEHKRFVAKVRSLDPSYRDVMPWQPRAYSRKRARNGDRVEDEERVRGEKKLFSPLLAREETAEASRKKPGEAQELEQCSYSSSGSSVTLGGYPELVLGSHESVAAPAPPFTTTTTSPKEVIGSNSSNRGGGLLGLDYSSSSDSSEEEDTS